uniref:Extended synaptotagmin-like protein 1a n=1 Tax=Cyprinus carpio carpio TaxID=630221 RepID=A0A8C1F4Z5_CYPCA
IAGAAPEAADSALPQDSAGKQAVSVLWSFGKCLCALLPAYLAGYFGFGISVVVLGLLVYIGWKHSRDGKQARLQSAMYYSLENKQDVTTARVFRSKRELPAWVNFPDVEKVEWMNQILQQAWPFIGQYLEKLLVETIAPSIRATSTYLQTLSFTKVNLGDKAMRVVGVKAYTENDKRQVILDLYISYAGDLEINVEVKRYFSKAGVKGIQLHGRLRVILEPLIGDVPLIGAITMFFIRRPKLDINWTGLTNLLDIPCLNNLSDTMIMDAIASFLVLPNRLTVPLVANLQVAQLRSPLPRGIVRIHLLEAENLTAKDYLISGKSDPYAVLRVGTQTFTSHYVDNNLNPQWKEMYEVIVHEVPGQELELEWFTLKDVPSGQVHLKLEWLSLLPSAERLDEVLERNKKIITVYGKTANPPSAAILTVYLDRAQDLPFKKGNKDPSPMVQISVQETTKESRTVYGTNNPVWEDAFTFFIQDPRKQDIDIQVKDEDRSLTLGGLSIPLSSLLSSAELSMDQWFQLEKSGPASRIYITAMLRGVLRIHLVEAQSLVAKDSLMGGLVEGKSDPFVKIRVGGLAFKSQVIKENLNPIWNELYEVCMLIDFMCNVASFLKEKDFISSCCITLSVKYQYCSCSDLLSGCRVKVSLGDLISAQFTDQVRPSVHVCLFVSITFIMFFFLLILLFTPIYACVLVQWYTLNDVKSGRLHLVLEWVPKVSDPTRLDQILHYNNRQSYLNKIVPSAAMLFVYVERAHGLPLKKSGKEPEAGAEVSLKNVSHRTKVANPSTSPQWNEAFHFLIHNPSEDTLIVKLTHSWGQALGSLVLPVRELLDQKDLVLDRWFSLDEAMPESQILLRAELKVRNHTHIQHVLSSRMHLHSARMKYIIQTALAGEDASSTGKAQVKLSVAYLSEENRLVITVHACRNLPSYSKDPPDTYISFILLPDKNRNTKRKTSVKKKSLKPEFNERFDFDMSLEEAKQKQLEVSVKNSVSFMSREKELLGKLQLDFGQLDPKIGLSQWYVLHCCSL